MGLSDYTDSKGGAGNQVADGIERLARRYGLWLCVECGKCVAVCPMWELFDGFVPEASPRRVIARAVRGLELAEHSGVWFCLTCDLCTNFCPAGVRFRDFVTAARQLIIEAGVTEFGAFCRSCGAYLWPQHTVECLKRKLGETTEEFLVLCPRCRRYDFCEKVKALAPGKKVHTRTTQMAEGRSRGYCR
jgi:Fe-S oxidoreductase